MGSEGSAARLLGYVVIGVIAFGGIGTALVVAAAAPELSHFFMPLVVITSVGMIVGWAGSALSVLLRARIQRFR